MTFDAFVQAVDNLVAEWAHPSGLGSTIPREKLRAIFDDVSEQAVHRLAEAVQQRDLAMSKLHKQYVREVVDIIKTTGKPRRGRPPNL